MPEPKENEVWITNCNNLALIVTGPSQFMEIDGVTPPGATYFPAVYPKRRNEQGKALFMLWYDRFDGFTVSEIMQRLKSKTDLSPVDFFLRENERQRQDMELKQQTADRVAAIT